MQSNPVPPHLRRPNPAQNQNDSTQAAQIQSKPVPPHLRRSNVAQSQDVLVKATAAQSKPMPPHQKRLKAADSQEVLTESECLPPHLRKQQNNQIVSGELHSKPDSSPGSDMPNVKAAPKEHTPTEEPVVAQTGTKLAIAASESNSEMALAQIKSHKLPPHLRRSNTPQVVKSSTDNEQTFNQGPILPLKQPSDIASATQSISGHKPVQQNKCFPSTVGDSASSGVPKWQGDAESPNSPLSAVGSRKTSNTLTSPITITSPDPSSAGSPIHIFPFHLRKAQVASSLVKSEVTTVKHDDTQICDNPDHTSRSESVTPRAGCGPAKLPPHLRGESSISNENTKYAVEQRSSTPLNPEAATSQQNDTQPPKREPKPHYIPPHLRGKKSSTKQSSNLNNTTASSIRNDTASGHSSCTVGGVPVGSNHKILTAPNSNLEKAVAPSPQSGSGSAQLKPCQGEEHGTGFVEGADSGVAKDVVPRIYSDASIKTHSTRKNGSCDSDEWADLRKPGPVKSLCISDNGIEDDASVKKFIGTALAECPGEVIKLKSLNDEYFHPADHTGQEWHWDITEEFLHAYVKVWREKLPEEVVIVDVKAAKFQDSFPININSFMDSLEHPESFPNNREKQETWTSKIAMDRRQKRKLAIARRRQRGKNTYFVPNMQLGVQPFDWGEAPVPEKPYIAIHVRPAEIKDIPGITIIYNQWILNSFIPEDQQPITEKDIKSVFEAARKDSYPFIVAIRGDPPIGNRVAKSNEVVGFAMVERCLGFGGVSNGRSRSTATIQFYVHQECLRHGIGGHLLDQLLRRVSRLHVPFSDRNLWINPTKDTLYEQIPTKFHQVVVNRPMDRPNDPDFMWFDAFMKKYKIWESHRTLSVARKPPTTSGPSATFLDIVTYQHEAELHVRVED
ncbi:hypothetical protein V494_04043 [Pseudogymnoascus sp. VKM F-4513 (FW-928)]|nr:hypothetical protein V494_04043 [Pseudogymnoascus sp. VKM F-4513 (FW-928)]